MTRKLHIDVVSDVVCPWCVVGLRALEQALERLDGEVDAEIQLHPFELNPDMAPEGEDVAEHIARKYGASPERSAATREVLRESAAAVGFDMAPRPDARIWNTFDAHRLLRWAAAQGRALLLKHALFEAHFIRGEAVSVADVLVAAATAAGLDAGEARAVLAQGRYAAEVRDEERRWRQEGVTAVPTFVIDGRYVISGAHPVEAFERALRKIASAEAAAA